MRSTHRTPSRSIRIASAALLAMLVWPTTAAAGSVEVSGLLDLVAAGKSEAVDRNVRWAGGSPFDGYLVKIFLDGAVNDHLQVFTQLQFAESWSRAFGAYAMATPWEEKDVHVVAGLIPWLVGTYEPQSYSDKNPLIGTPMLYQYHTSMRANQFPDSASQVLGKSGQGYSQYGLPVVDSDWWDFGVGVLGSLRPMEFSLGYVNGAPSYPSPDRDKNMGKTVQGRIGLAPGPAVRFGVSGAYGPYMVDGAQGTLPPGRAAEDYHQVLAMADAEWAVSHLSLRAEGYRNTWETPHVGDLRVKGFYAEAKYTLPAGFYLAGRYEIMEFSDLTDTTGEKRPWDANQTRVETGLGYRISRGVLAKAVFQRNLEEKDEDEPTKRRDLAAAQLSIRF